jgi:hypothetical protein
MSTMSACQQKIPSRHHTKALVANVEIPEVNAEVVSRNVGLAVRIDRYRIDVVGVSVGVDFSRDGRSD